MNGAIAPNLPDILMQPSDIVEDTVLPATATLSVVNVSLFVY